jgi:hypothetical protein
VKQSLGVTVQFCTKHDCETKVSQKVASVSAQSAGWVQGLPAPKGGRLQYAGEALASQTKPPVHSVSVAQPVVVQYPPPTPPS